MRIRLDDIHDLEPGDRLNAAYVHRCLEEGCQEKFIGKVNAQFCSTRCGNRARQRRLRERRSVH